MAYIITTTAGATLTTIADDTVNTTSTSLNLVGKNYSGYGVFLNENFVQLLENFNNSLPPSSPLTGQLWYDSNGSVLKFYTGSSWKLIHTSAASAIAPANPITGDLWFDTINVQLKVRSSSDWVVIGPATSTTGPAGQSGPLVTTLVDNTSQSHIVTMFYLSNSVIAILSKDSVFTPQAPITGFTTIGPGLNLISTSALPNSRFWGNATNAFTVNNISTTSLVRADQDSSMSPHRLTVGRLQVGTDLLIDPTPGTEVQIYSNGTSTYKDLNLYVNRGGTQTRAVGISATTAGVSLFGNLITTNVAPTLDNVSWLGTPARRYANVFATTVTCTNLYGSTFYGNVIGSISGGTTGNLEISGFISVNSQSQPVAIFNAGTSGVGNIGTAANPFNVIHARATSAQYADVAERFETDAPLCPGTVVELGGLKEITAAVQELSENVFGVISTLPGFLLNGVAGDDTTHPPVAVNGRVPVRVIGRIAKGDRLVSAGNGLARSATKDEYTAFNVIGRSLEDKNTSGEGLIEAVVKLNS